MTKSQFTFFQQPVRVRRMADEPVAYRGRVKYTEDRARAYQKRGEDKHEREMQLIDRVFATIPPGLEILDMPCGGGRVMIHLAKKGYRANGADLSESMVTIARENAAQAGVQATVQQKDIEALDIPDKTYDLVVSFRLFHHFPSADIRQRAVTQLCRVSKRFVVLSYFSPWSFTSIRNKLRQATGVKKISKFSTPLSEVVGYFEPCGFKLNQDFAELPLVHTLHAAVFERR